MKLFFSLVFLLSFLVGTAQKITISGYVKDEVSSETLIGAAVLDQKSGAGITSNPYGFYSLTLNKNDSVQLVCTYVGYQAQVISFIAAKDTVINFTLDGEQMLEEIEVIAEQAERLEESTRMSTISIPVKQLKLLPAFMGEADVLKALQLMPGVQSGSEGTSGLYVRGGGPDQNLILLDGVPVYNVSHLFGFFSIFNPDAVKRVELTKGGFPARYGGRLSSVVDISLKEGNMQEVHGEGAIGLIASKLTLEGPIIKDKASFMISGRRTYIDLLARPIIKNAASQNGDEVVVGYHFHDVNAKFNYKFSEKDRLYFSVYTGKDKAYSRYSYENNDNTSNFYSSNEEFGLRWGNVISALRWNHIYNPKLFSNVTLTYSRYLFDIFSNYEDVYREDDRLETEVYNAKYISGINDVAGKIDFDYYPSPNHSIRFGTSAIYHTFEPGAFNLTSNEIPDIDITQNTYALEYALYAEDDIKISKKLNANVGLHISAFSVKDELYTSIQPRISARYLLKDRLSIKASYAQMAQFINLLANSGIGLPTDLWVPSTDNIRPQEAWQVALGAAKTFENGLELSLEGYYKEMTNLVEYNEGASFLEIDTDWETQVTQGNGESYGIEMLLQKKRGKTTGWIGYTLSWSNRQFARLNFGKKYPYKFDRRHDVSIAIVHEWKPKVDLSVAWVYGSGNTVTLPIAEYEGLPEFYNELEARGRGNSYKPTINYYGERNSFRMRAYHRLDINFRFKKEKKWGERTWAVGVYNTYSRKNPFYIDKSYDYDNDKEVFVQYSLFPIIPNISYSFKF